MADAIITFPLYDAASGDSTARTVKVKAVDIGSGLYALAVSDLGSGTGVQSVTNGGYTAQVSITRPSNTTAYTAGDVVGATAAAITFPTIGPAAGWININDADLRIDLTSIPSGMTSFRLHLYSVTPPSALADNAPWDLPSGDRSAYLGYIDLGSPALAGASSLFVQVSGVGFKEILMGASTSLFGYLVTNAGWTPTSAGTLAVRLNARGL